MFAEGKNVIGLTPLDGVEQIDERFVSGRDSKLAGKVASGRGVAGWQGDSGGRRDCGG